MCINFIKINNRHIIRLSSYRKHQNKPLYLEYPEETIVLFTSSLGECVTSPILQNIPKKDNSYLCYKHPTYFYSQKVFKNQSYYRAISVASYS